MRSKQPLVSILMPAYNEEAHIRSAFESLLAQDYENFELVVRDNASTDATYDICREFQRRDARIKCLRNQRNVGMGDIKNLIEGLQGDFFMVAGAHDVWHPSYISKLLSVLQAEPEVVIAYPLTMLIDNEGREIRLMSDRLDTRGLPVFDRYRKLVWEFQAGNMLYGLIRSPALAYVSWKRVWGPDHLTAAELSLLGSIAQVNEVLFFRREVRQEIWCSDESKRRIWNMVDPKEAEWKAKLSDEALGRELRDAHVRLVLTSPRLTFADRLRATATTLLCFRARFGVRSGIGYLLELPSKIMMRSRRLLRTVRGGAGD